MHRESHVSRLPDAHNHLATSLLVKSASASRRHLRHRHGRTSSAEDAHDLASVSSSLDGAMRALRSALRLNPAAGTTTLTTTTRSSPTHCTRA